MRCYSIGQYIYLLVFDWTVKGLPDMVQQGQQNQRDVKEANKLSKSSWLQNFG
jgi:hypothetical protein